MVAAMYGSLETVIYLVGAGVYVNTQSTDDGFTALHCATSSGSSKCVQITAVLLKAGVDISIRDAAGRRAVDVMSNLLLGEALAALECMLGADMLSSTTLKQSGAKLTNGQPEIEKEEYQNDEFRMFEFKVKRCSRTRAHDWTQCPFAHPGEKARRRDPRRYSYSGIACPDFRKGACPRGDACDLAHGVFECWLHPTRYRTQLCKDGMSCPRRVCFFAHCPSELRQPQLTQQLTQIQVMQSPMSAVVDQGMHQFVALSHQPPSNFSRGNSSSESSSLDDPSPLSADFSVQNVVPLVRALLKLLPFLSSPVPRWVSLLYMYNMCATLCLSWSMQNPIAAAYVSKIKPMATESSPNVDALCQEVISMDIRSNNRGTADSGHKVPVLPVTANAAVLGSDTRIASSGPELPEVDYMSGFKGKYLPADGKAMQKTASFLQMVEDNQCWVADMVNDE